MPDSSSSSDAAKNFRPGRTARVYAAFKGGQSGKEAYPADHEMADMVKTLPLDPVLIAKHIRGFHNRVVRYLVERLGILQVVDIGAGFPDHPDTHYLAQTIDPAASVVYCDNDPLVELSAQAYFRSVGTGSTSFVLADVRYPEELLARIGPLVDFSQPVAFLLNAVLHFVEDEDDPQHIMDTLVAALPEGSVVVLSHSNDDGQEETMRAAEALYRSQGHPARIRSRAEITELLSGLVPDEVGLVPVNQWRPDEEVTETDPLRVPCLGVLAYKKSA